MNRQEQKAEAQERGLVVGKVQGRGRSACLAPLSGEVFAPVYLVRTLHLCFHTDSISRLWTSLGLWAGTGHGQIELDIRQKTHGLCFSRLARFGLTFTLFLRQPSHFSMLRSLVRFVPRAEAILAIYVNASVAYNSLRFCFAADIACKFLRTSGPQWCGSRALT